MKPRFAFMAAAVIALAAGATLWAADQFGEEIKCPVSGKAVNPDAFVEYNGGKVYFCCENCPKTFQKNPDKYAAKANHQMALNGQIHQVACPITGKPTNESTAIDVQGVQVAFCCKNCKAKVEKAEGAAQLELVFGAKAKGWEPNKTTK